MTTGESGALLQGAVPREDEGQGVSVRDVDEEDVERRGQGMGGVRQSLIPK